MYATPRLLFFKRVSLPSPFLLECKGEDRSWSSYLGLTWKSCVEDGSTREGNGVLTLLNWCLIHLFAMVVEICILSKTRAKHLAEHCSDFPDLKTDSL